MNSPTTNMSTYPSIDYVPMSPMATAVRNAMYPSENKGGGLKALVSIVVMVAIPVLAPALVSAVGVSASLAANVAAGAFIGGATSAVQGDDWKRGALMGGIAGGISYNAPTTSATGAGSISNAQGAEMGMSPLETADYNLATAAQSTAPAVGTESFAINDAQGAEMGLDSLETADYNTQMGFTDGGTTTSAAADSLGSTQTANTGTTGGTGTTPSGTAAGLNTTGAPAATTPPAVTPPATTTFAQDFKAGMGKAFSAENLGKAALQTGGNALINASIQSDYSEEQQQLIDQRQAEVTRLEAQGAEVDAIKLAEARSMLQQAMQVDPTYLARQKANAAKNQAANATNEAIRTAGSSGRRSGYTDSIRRRGNIEGAKNSASAFDSGFQGGLKQKTDLQKAGVGLLPSSAGLSGYYTNLGSQYDSAEKARDEERAGYQKLFGDSLV